MRYRSVLLASILAVMAALVVGCGETITPTPPQTNTPTPPLTGSPVASRDQQELTPGPTVTGLPDIASVVERTAPAVVSVLASVQTTNFLGQVIEQTSQGSGVIFDERGYILTNNHVVEGAREVIVTLHDRTRHTAEIVGRDPQSDLAVLKIDPNRVENLVIAPLGNTDAMRIGDWVIAIGCPLGLCDTVTVGVVSAKHRQLRIDATTQLYDLVQTDAVINPGNSGGPLLNLRGEVIGINTAIIRGALGNNQEADGIGFAVSMNTAVPVATQIIETGTVRRAVLGIEVAIMEVTPWLAEERELAVDYGVLVERVIPGGGAAAAGIEPGDIIVAMDEHEVRTFTDLQRLLLAEYRPGDTTLVTVVRGATHVSLEVRLGERTSQ